MYLEDIRAHLVRLVPLTLYRLLSFLSGGLSCAAPLSLRTRPCLGSRDARSKFCCPISKTDGFDLKTIKPPRVLPRPVAWESRSNGDVRGGVKVSSQRHRTSGFSPNSIRVSASEECERACRPEIRTPQHLSAPAYCAPANELLSPTFFYAFMPVYVALSLSAAYRGTRLANFRNSCKIGSDAGTA